jgi:hypothetical protein
MINNIKASTVGYPCHIFIEARRTIVDRGGTKGLNDVLFVGCDRSENLGSKGAGNLHRDMTDAAGTCVNEHCLTGGNVCTIALTFPRRNRNHPQTQRAGFSCPRMHSSMMSNGTRSRLITPRIANT